MPPSLETTCARCGARTLLRGARAFTPQPCPACGAPIRGRMEIGGYRLGDILARGGLSVVFRATDLTGAALAVKLIQPPFAAQGMDVEYFVSEVWALARLNHPHCVRIFATGVESELAWIAMEWLSHGSLAARLATRGKLREAEVIAIGLQAAGALGAAAAAGHLHYHVTPSNLVFADARTVKLTDFGEAALYRISAADLGTMWGRATEVAPERMRNEPEEAYSDIYALGATLFHALTGGPPHGGDPSPLNVLERLDTTQLHVEKYVPALHEKTAQVLDKMLASEPAQRFQHWSEVIAQLSQAATLVARRDAAAANANQRPSPTLELRPEKRRPPSKIRARLVAVTLAIVVTALTGFAAWRLHSSASVVPVPQTRAVR